MEVVKKETKTTKKSVNTAAKKEKAVKKETTIKAKKENNSTEEVKEEYIAPIIEVKNETETDTLKIVDNLETVTTETSMNENNELNSTSIDDVMPTVEENETNKTLEVDTEIKEIETTQPKRTNSAFNHYWNGQSSGW